MNRFLSNSRLPHRKVQKVYLLIGVICDKIYSSLPPKENGYENFRKFKTAKCNEIF